MKEIVKKYIDEYYIDFNMLEKEELDYHFEQIQKNLTDSLSQLIRNYKEQIEKEMFVKYALKIRDEIRKAESLGL